MTAGTLLYCRPGFERECAQEIGDAAAALGIAGYVKAREDSGYALFVPHEDGAAARLRRELRFADFIFPRQIVHQAVLVEGLPTGDRITPLLAALRQNFDARFAELWLETADTNEAKELGGFLRRFGPAFESAAKNAGILGKAPDGPRLHAFFLSSAAVYLGLTDAANASPWPLGIPRLRMPAAAPSRSTLKLAEALMVFLSREEADELLHEGGTAVDLGAAPGGWTWQLVRRGLHVTAIDNGNLDPALMASGQVEHLHADGLAWRPKRPVDWVVCDMIEKPSRIAALIGDWLAEGHARYAIFNLKLPMKKRRDEVIACRELIAARLAGKRYALGMRQLYHDREEVTVFLRLLDRSGR